MTKKITKLMLNGEEYEIREYQQGGWQPGVNTIGYWKLEENTDATVGTTTSSNNVTFTTLASGKKVGVFDGSSSRIVIPALPTGTNNTYLARVNKTGDGTGEMQAIVLCGGSGKKGTALRTNTTPRGCMSSQYDAWTSLTGATSNNTWYFVAIVQNSSGSIYYLNGNQASISNVTGANSNAGSAIGSNSSSAQDFFKGYISEVIVEDKERTAQEISDYFNQTKGDYGIS